MRFHRFLAFTDTLSMGLFENLSVCPCWRHGTCEAGIRERVSQPASEALTIWLRVADLSSNPSIDPDWETVCEFFKFFKF